LLITLLGLLVDPENVVPSSETSVNFWLHGHIPEDF
jgi:hypothetical protein